MAKTANEEWFDAMVRHQIHLVRHAGSVRNEIIEILNNTEEDLAREIRDRLRGVRGNSPAALRKAERLLKTVREIRGGAWGAAQSKLSSSLDELATSEAQFLQSSLNTVSPVVLETAVPSTRTLQSAVESEPFQGKLLSEWADNMKRSDLGRIRDAVRVGMTEGESSAQIARRVVGSARQRGMNGVLQMTRREVQAVTRTATMHVSNHARNAFLAENDELFEKERYTATLDHRTTPVCRANDGKSFPRAEGPMPPLHIQCRSLRVAEINGQVVGSRPARNHTQQQLEREYAQQNGFEKPLSRNNLPRGHKGRFDEFARRRKRELTGQLPARTTYNEWLRNQSAANQNDILGQTKGKLFREGNLDVDRFVDRQGSELTLPELAQRDAAAFRSAGLDPDEYT